MADPRELDYRAIEAAAREQVRAEIAAAENTPLEFGAYIVWAECRFGTTNGFSAVHRVGFPKLGMAFTTCEERIPAPTLWVPSQPAFLRSLEQCLFCEAEMTRITRENAA